MAEILLSNIKEPLGILTKKVHSVKMLLSRALLQNTINPHVLSCWNVCVLQLSGMVSMLRRLVLCSMGRGKPIQQ